MVWCFCLLLVYLPARSWVLLFCLPLVCGKLFRTTTDATFDLTDRLTLNDGDGAGASDEKRGAERREVEELLVSERMGRGRGETKGAEGVRQRAKPNRLKHRALKGLVLI